MINEVDIRKIITGLKTEIKSIDTNEYSLGKLHHHYSMAFVAGVGRWLKGQFPGESYEVRFKDFKDGKAVSGEWLLDAVVVKTKNVEEAGKKEAYAHEIALAMESEFHPGLKALVEDLSKLFVVKSDRKLYINGVKNVSRKHNYVEKRLEVIRSMIPDNEKPGNYTICFVDHPRLWGNSEIFVRVVNLGDGI